MEIIPAIDLQNRRVVHARGGDRKNYLPLNTAAFPSSHPSDVVRRLRRHAIFYIADLDSIMGCSMQSEALRQIRRELPHATLWLDAGIRNIDDYRRIRAEIARISDESGVARSAQPGQYDRLNKLIVGSETLTDLAVLEELKRTQMDYILSLDFDVRGLRGPDALSDAVDYWPRTVIVLALNAVGGGHPRWDLLKDIRASDKKKKLAYGGGVRNRGDLEKIKAAGADYVLVANALYTSVLV